MDYNDRSPPHFHAKSCDEQASTRIDNGQVIEGMLADRALRLAEEWQLLHVAELQAYWLLPQARQPLTRIAPLE
jgi:hypothetical protein